MAWLENKTPLAFGVRRGEIKRGVFNSKQNNKLQVTSDKVTKLQSNSAGSLRQAQGAEQ